MGGEEGTERGTGKKQRAGGGSRAGAASRCRLTALPLPPLACLCRGQSAEFKAAAALLTFLIALPFLGHVTRVVCAMRAIIAANLLSVCSPLTSLPALLLVSVLLLGYFN